MLCIWPKTSPYFFTEDFNRVKSSIVLAVESPKNVLLILKRLFKVRRRHLLPLRSLPCIVPQLHCSRCRPSHLNLVPSLLVSRSRPLPWWVFLRCKESLVYTNVGVTLTTQSGMWFLMDLVLDKIITIRIHFDTTKIITLKNKIVFWLIASFEDGRE